MKTLKEFNESANRFKPAQKEFYVWTRKADGGRWIHINLHRKTWVVLDGSKVAYGGFVGGSNTHAAKPIMTTRKEAVAWIAGHEAGTELGEFPALRKAHEDRRRRPEQKAYRDGVLTAIKESK
jgi:hypothetical protein